MARIWLITGSVAVCLPVQYVNVDAGGLNIVLLTRNIDSFSVELTLRFPLTESSVMNLLCYHAIHHWKEHWSTNSARSQQR